MVWYTRRYGARMAVIDAAKANARDCSAGTLNALHKAVGDLERIEKEEPK